MESVPRPWTVHSREELNEEWARILDSHQMEIRLWETCVIIPPWKQSPERAHEERSRLLIEQDWGLTVVERFSDNSSTIKNIHWCETILVEEGIAILLAWISFWWKVNGNLEQIRIEFHSAATTELHKLAQKALRIWGLDASPTSSDRNAPCTNTEVSDLYRYLLSSSLGFRERIEYMIHQPEVRAQRGGMRKRKSKKKYHQLVVQTPFRWIIIADNDGLKNLEYGTRITSLRRSEWNLKLVGPQTLVWTAAYEWSAQSVRVLFSKERSDFWTESTFACTG